MLHWIDTDTANEELTKYQKFQDLKNFYFFFKQTINDFEKAMSINRIESQLIVKEFYLKNPIFRNE